MNIRLAQKEDIPALKHVFSIAREFMKQTGNPTQWAEGYPDEKLLARDMENKNCYVFVEQDRIVGTFTFILGEDPTYKVIEEGEWHKEEAYGTVHRLASDGSVKGLAKRCFDFCGEKNSYLRIDTHKDNKPMQGAIEKYGFKQCGIIYVANGTPRIAYDYIG